MTVQEKITADAAERPVSTAPVVYDAVSAVMLYMSKEGIGKDRKSGGNGPTFNFRGIDDIYNALSGVMAENRLMMLPRVLKRDQVERSTKNGGALFYTTVEVEFDLVSAEDGSKHTIRTYGEAMDSSDKSTNKAMSAAFKYAAMQAFCIPTEGDNDADASSHEVASRELARERQQRPAAPNREAIAWVDKLKSSLHDCVTEDEVQAIADKNAKSLARLKAEEPSLYAEWDHAFGIAVAAADNVPF